MIDYASTIAADCVRMPVKHLRNRSASDSIARTLPSGARNDGPSGPNDYQQNYRKYG